MQVTLTGPSDARSKAYVYTVECTIDRLRSEVLSSKLSGRVREGTHTLAQTDTRTHVVGERQKRRSTGSGARSTLTRACETDGSHGELRASVAPRRVGPL